MARKDGKDRGILYRRDSWWVRIYHNGRQRWFKCDNKTQAKAYYGRLKGEQREEKYFPDKFTKKKAITLRAWIQRVIEGSTNRDKVHERQRAQYWSEIFGSRLLSEITTEDLRLHQVKMKNSGQWSPATINRYFAALRRILTLAVNGCKP